MVYVILSKSAHGVSVPSINPTWVLTKVGLVPRCSAIDYSQIVLPFRQTSDEEMKPPELFTLFFPVGTGTSRPACKVCHLCVVDQDSVVAVVVDLIAIDVYRGTYRKRVRCDGRDA